MMCEHNHLHILHYVGKVRFDFNSSYCQYNIYRVFQAFRWIKSKVNNKYHQCSWWVTPGRFLLKLGPLPMCSANILRAHNRFFPKLMSKKTTKVVENWNCRETKKNYDFIPQADFSTNKIADKYWKWRLWNKILNWIEFMFHCCRWFQRHPIYLHLIKFIVSYFIKISLL